MEVKPGYKQTEVGILPEQWQILPLAELAHIKTGKRNNEEKVADGEYPFFVRSEVVERINSYSYEGEAILVPGEGRIGDIFHYVNGRFDVHQRVYAITRFRADCHAQYLHRYMAQRFGAWAMQNTVKATVDSLRLPTFQHFLVPLPPPPEQRAIASALSDVDALLGGLDRFIAKKRDLKQAAMQQLLTGQTRLPGFHGEWEVKPLKHFVTGDRFAIVDGPFGSQLKVDEYVDSGIPVIEMEHLSDDVITERIYRCITSRKFEDLKRSAVYPGDIIISKTGSLGKLGLIPDRVERGLITSRLAKITLDPSHADRRFVFQVLLKLRSESYWEKVSQGGTMQILGIRMLQNAPIPNIAVPEQTAIAAVLSDMDAELAALEARRDKTRDLKQAMMQELLTGKTRLVEPASVRKVAC